MNFDFMMECEIKDPKIKAAYDEIYKELVDAEAHYWKEPQQSGILFRKTAERIGGGREMTDADRTWHRFCITEYE